MSAVLSLRDLEARSRACLPASLFSYVCAGSDDGESLLANAEAFRQWQLLPSVLVDVSARSQKTTLFGQAYEAPFGIAPMGLAALCAFDGDRQLARAAARVNVPYVLSGASTTPLEAVIRENEASWFQAYLSAQWEHTHALLRRVDAAGFRTLVVTVDVPIAALREAEIRSGFSVPLKLRPKLVAGGLLRPRWLVGTLARTVLTQGMPRFENLSAGRGGPIFSTRVDHRTSRAGLNWDHLARVRDAWKGHLVLKGVLRAADARTAASLGVDGVIVSNHGGRQLDGSIATLAALRGIVAAAPGLSVMLDGGVRRGTDVLKALALGARCVFLGRPMMHALASAAQQGVESALHLLQREVDVDLALLGCPSIQDLRPAHLVPRQSCAVD